MKIYLLQHGSSFSEEINPERPLTEIGEKDIKSLAIFLKPLGIQVYSLFHSGILRAKQTAEIIEASLSYPGGIQEKNGISPFDSVNEIVEEIYTDNNDFFLVGHMPFIEKLVGQLVVGDPSISLVKFKPGTIICLERVKDNSWVIAWMIGPELLINHS